MIAGALSGRAGRGDDFQLLPRENGRGRGSRLLLTADVSPCSDVNKFPAIATGNARRSSGDEAIIMRGDIAD